MTVEPSADDPTVFGPVDLAAAALPTVTRDGLVVTTTTDGGVVTVRVVGELLHETRTAFSDAVGPLAATSRDLLVDLSATTFMDSTGLGTLVLLRNQVVHRGGTFRLVRPEERVFQVVHLDRAFEFDPAVP